MKTEIVGQEETKVLENTTFLTTTHIEKSFSDNFNSYTPLALERSSSEGKENSTSFNTFYSGTFRKGPLFPLNVYQNREIARLEKQTDPQIRTTPKTKEEIVSKVKGEEDFENLNFWGNTSNYILSKNRKISDTPPTCPFKSLSLQTRGNSSIISMKEPTISMPRTIVPPIFNQEKSERVMNLIRHDRVFHELNPDYPVFIGTHSGTFHCDEVLAIVMLRILPEYKDAAIVRTRDKTILDQCDIVVDVGAEYESGNHRYDHHQRGFDHTMEGYNTKLSSSGLIYKHFGKRVIDLVINRKVSASVDSTVTINPKADGTVTNFDESVVEKLYIKVYEDFMESIDGIDNGVTHAEGNLNYKIESHLSARVGRLNPSWNIESDNEDMGKRFSMALQLVSTEFYDYLIGLAESWWPGRLLVEEAFEKRFENHPSGGIIVLERYCPWIAHLEDIESDFNLPKVVKYVLYMDNHGAWRIHAAPVSSGSFTSRLPLPEAWRGLREKELDAVTEIDNCAFVHANGFIGGNKTFEGTLQMGIKSIEMQEEEEEQSQSESQEATNSNGNGK